MFLVFNVVRPLNARRSNADKWMVPGVVQRACNLAKFARLSASLHNLAVEYCRSGRQLVQAHEGKRSVKSCWRMTTRNLRQRPAIAGTLAMHSRMGGSGSVLVETYLFERGGPRIEHQRWICDPRTYRARPGQLDAS